MNELNVPIDPIHAMCAATVRLLNETVQALKERASKWEPGEMPKDWVPPRR